MKGCWQWAELQQLRLNSTRVTHLWSQTSQGWVTSCVWPHHDPSTSVLRISCCEAPGPTITDAPKGNSEVILWSVSTLELLFKPHYRYFFLSHSVLLVFLLGAICRRSFFKDETWFWGFFLHRFWVKQMISVHSSGLSQQITQELHIPLRHWLHTKGDEIIHSLFCYHAWTWNSTCLYCLIIKVCGLLHFWLLPLKAVLDIFGVFINICSLWRGLIMCCIKLNMVL